MKLSKRRLSGRNDLARICWFMRSRGSSTSGAGQSPLVYVAEPLPAAFAAQWTPWNLAKPHVYTHTLRDLFSITNLAGCGWRA